MQEIAGESRKEREKGRGGKERREEERDRVCSVGDDGETPASSQSTWLAGPVCVG